jgi:hypothetical protein
MTHRTRFIQKRQWDADYGPYTGHPDDPRTDDRTGDEIYEEEQAFARLRQANKQRQLTPTRSSE